MATRTDSWAEFFRAISYERQPPLIYLLFKAAAGLNELAGWLPFDRIPHAVCWPFSVASVGIIILRLKAPAWLRYSLPFTLLMLFEYGIIARGYGPAFFFLMAAADARQRGRETVTWWCLAMSGAFHLYFTFVCSALFCFEIWSRRAVVLYGPRGNRLRLHAGGAGLLLAMTFILLLPPIDSKFPRTIEWPVIGWRSLLEPIGFAFGGVDTLTGDFRWNLNIWKSLPLFPIPLFLLALWRQGFPLVRFLGAIAGALLVMAGSGYPVSYRYAAILFAAALYLALAERACLERRFPVFAVPIVLMLFMTGRWLATVQPWEARPNRLLSGADAFAAKTGPLLQESVTVVDVKAQWLAFSILGRFARPPTFISASRGVEYEYPIFGRTGDFMSTREWCREHRESVARRFAPARILFLSTSRTDVPPECEPVRLIFRNHRASISREDFALYEFVEE